MSLTLGKGLIGRTLGAGYNALLTEAGDALLTEAGDGLAIEDAVVFDRASLSATGYFIDYGGGTWAGTASAGTSASNSFVAGVPPSVGASFGSHPSADFGGTNDLTHSTLADFITEPAYAFHFVVEMDTAAAPAGGGSEYTDPAFISDRTNGELYVTFTTAGVLVGHYDGSAFHNTTPIPLATGVKACVQARYDGANIQCRVNGLESTGSPGWESVAAGNVRTVALGHDVFMGASYAGIGMIDGRIALAMAFATAIVDADMDNLLADARTNFGVP